MPKPSHRLLAGPLLVSLALLASCARPPTPEYPPLPSVARDSSDDPSVVEVSLVRVSYRFEEDGRYKRTFEDRFRILDEDAVEAWGSTSATWSPWHMKRPLITATVTSPTGKKTLLDPAAIAESSAYPNAPDMYGDERTLRAPLPNVGPGATVDETITYESTRPWIGGGEVLTEAIQVGLARQRVEIVIDVPEKLPLRYELRDASIPVQESKKSGRRVLTFAGGPYPAVKPLEAGAPSDIATWPTLAFTTNTAWRPLAKEYARIVDQKLVGANLEGVVAKVVQATDTPAVKAEKLMAWIRARVRYVAVEFGDSSVVPRTPDETLKHGYGDCKDQAVLLVGLLRAAGVPANVALLRAGFGEDVIPSLPGLNVFNHAIVHVPGAKLWIDPTSTRARAGDLPTPDQGRWSLIVDGGSDALVRTPHADHGDNTYSELRQVFFAEYGPSRVVEAVAATGAIERSLRDRYDADAATLAKWQKSYIGRAYSSEEPGLLEVTDAKDLGKPFAIKVEAKRARHAVTGLAEASTWIDPGLALAYVPSSLIYGVDRKLDYALEMPHDTTVVFELHPPAGFAVEKKPEPRVVFLGPASYRESVEVKPDGTVIVTAKLSMPKERWTAAEVTAFRKSYGELMSADQTAVTFLHEGERLHRARAYDKEIAAYRAELAKTPDSALVKLRLAYALRDLGFAGAGRKLADEVAKTDPKVADYWADIGYIRSSDKLGRLQRAGWDRAGALAAYRKALELDPNHTQASINLAIALEHDDSGERYASVAQLDEAIAAWDHFPKNNLETYRDGAYLPNLFYDLMWAGRFDKIRERGKKLDRAKLPEVPSIVAAAMLDGEKGGLTEFNRLAIAAERRNTVLVNAGDALVQLRRYPEAAALLGTAAASSSDPNLRSRVAMITKTKPIDAHALPVAKPVEVATKAALLCNLGEPSLSDDLVPLLSARLVTPKKEKRSEGVCGVTEGNSGLTKRNRTAIVDVLAAVFEPKVEGSDDLGWHVSLRIPSGGYDFFVQTENKTPRVRAVGSRPSEIGCEALTLAKAGKKAAAKQWLGWAKDIVPAGKGDDPLRDTPFTRLWSENKDDLEVAAAALCALDGHPEVNAPILTAARAKAKGDLVPILTQALVLAYADESHDAELVVHTTRLLKEVPASNDAFIYHALALRRLGRFKELRELSAERLAKEPNDPVRLEAMANAEELLGHVKEARVVGDKLLASGKATATSYNNQAWRSLFGGGVGATEIGWALRAVTLSNTPGFVNTLAALDAEAGHVADGLEQFQQSVAHLDEAKLGDADWFVYGRLAEQLGLKDEAKTAYLKIGPSPKDHGEHTVSKLAARRLELLKP